MKYFRDILTLGAVLIAMIALFAGGHAYAYSNSNMIDDGVFDKTSSMSTVDIQNFLNQFPSSCLKSYQAPDPQSWNNYGSMVSAAQVIKDASTMWGINPQVLLTTLEKEEGLVKGDGAYGCSPTALWSAMGYDCPGTATYSYTSAQVAASPNNYAGGVPSDMQGSIGPTCVKHATAVGFSAQVSHAAWQLEFGRQRSEGSGNFSWDGDNDIIYYGYMTQGTRGRCQMTFQPVECNSSYATPTFYSGAITLNDGTTLAVANGATASLYSYTPYIQSFDTIFSSWFGNPTSPCVGTANVSGAMSGFKIISDQSNPTGPTNLAFTVMNNTGSTCAEAHIWNAGFTSWLTHIAAGMRATDPSTGTLIASKAPVDNQESLNYVQYSGADGQVEIHRLSPNLQKFPGYYDVGTNLSGVSASTGMFVAGDFFGHGYDQLAYILYAGNTGHVEIHMLNPSMTKAVGYYDVATNLPSSVVNPSIGTFVAGDFLGRGYDQLAYVIYNNNTGHTEIHLFDPTLTKAVGYYDVATNLSGVSASIGTFIAGDFLGRGYSQLGYVIYNDNQGLVETHMFNQALTQATGTQDIITNLAGFNPSQ